MIIVDLTHTIHPGMPVFPGTEEPVLQNANTFEKDGFRETSIKMSSHTGTHIDAPAHMLASGPYLNNMDIDHFIGTAAILDFSDKNVEIIDTDDLKPYTEKIKNAEFIILKTGWSRYWGEQKYYEGFPSLSEAAAKWLTSLNLKGIGIDAISIDSMSSSTFSIHKILMKSNIIIIENLTNLDAISSEPFILSILPIKYTDADGSPVRAVGIENL